MAAFDVTTNPASQEVAPGSTAKIRVVVSNHLGRPVTARVDGALTPASAASWLQPVGEPQRKFEADPVATLNFDFTIAVPANASASTLTFRALVVDVLDTDENKAEGPAVAVKVTAKPAPPPEPPHRIPWWVWVVAAVVLIGAVIGIYFAVRHTGVPKVVGKAEADARTELEKAGFDSVFTVDSLWDHVAEGTVVAQSPKAGKPLPKKGVVDTAVVVVAWPGVEVPQINGVNWTVANGKLSGIGLEVDTTYNVSIGDKNQENRVKVVRPEPGTRVRKGSGVAVEIFIYDPTPPVTCTGIDCRVILDVRPTELLKRRFRMDS